MALELNDLIQVYDDVLDDELCKSLLWVFDELSSKHEFIDNNGCPTFTQVNFTENSNKSKEIEKIHNKVLSKIIDYKKVYYDYICNDCFPEDNSYEQLRIKKYNRGGEEKFDTHVDVKDYATARRFLSFLFYLNDHQSHGGETLFRGLTVRPKTGRLLIFPPMWMFPHLGYPPDTGPKYILTSYLHYK